MAYFGRRIVGDKGWQLARTTILRLPCPPGPCARLLKGFIGLALLSAFEDGANSGIVQRTRSITSFCFSAASRRRMVPRRRCHWRAGEFHVFGDLS